MHYFNGTNFNLSCVQVADPETRAAEVGRSNKREICAAAFSTHIFCRTGWVGLRVKIYVISVSCLESTFESRHCTILSALA